MDYIPCSLRHLYNLPPEIASSLKLLLQPPRVAQVHVQKNRSTDSVDVGSARDRSVDAASPRARGRVQLTRELRISNLGFRWWQ